MSGNRLSDGHAVAIANFIANINVASWNEDHFKLHVLSCEAKYGAYHGETGLALMKLADFLRRRGRIQEAVLIEYRIADITAIYMKDQAD